MDLEEKMIAQKRIFTGKILNLDVEDVLLPNGEQAQREIVHHHGAVAVLAVLDDKLLLVQQWREPMKQVTLEIPAGKIEPDATDLKAEALRELNEETGYQAVTLNKVSGFYSTPGFSDEYLTIFHAPQVEPAKKRLQLDDDEFLNVKWLSFSQVRAEIASGTICDAKTLMAILIWQNMRLEQDGGHKKD